MPLLCLSHNGWEKKQLNTSKNKFNQSNFKAMAQEAKTYHKERPQRELTKTIRRYGYELTLVHVDTNRAGHKSPCYMGYIGFALKSCKKIQDNGRNGG
jgi:hypothetical protein